MKTDPTFPAAALDAWKTQTPEEDIPQCVRCEQWEMCACHFTDEEED